MTRPPPRIPPVPRTEWSDAVLKVFAVMGDAFKWTDAPPNVIATLANHPKLAIPYLEFSKRLLLNSTLPARLRELVTLRVAWLWRSEYEWSQHVRLATEVGMTLEEFSTLKEDGSDSPVWSELERHALSATEELRTGCEISDATWQGLAQHLDRHQLMDLFFTIGKYIMLALVMNVLRIEMEAGHAGFVEP